MRPAILLSVLLLSTLTLAACDDAAQSCESPAPVDGDAPGALRLVAPVELQGIEPIAFREQGPPAGLYTSTMNGKPIHRAEAVAMINACAKQIDPPQTCSISWYQPDTSQPERVLGVGCSMMASYPLWKCYVDYMTGQKAIAY